MVETGSSQADDKGRTAGPSDLTICSWNINGLRRFEAASPKAGMTLRQCFEQLDATIICFQETKLLRGDLTEDLAMVEGYHAFFSFSQLRTNGGYSGVATYVKTSDVRVVAAAEGLRGCCGSVPVQACPLNCISFMERWQARIGSTDMTLLDELEQEGRVIITDHGGFVLLNVYMPASREGREDFKRAFHEAFRLRLEALVEAGRQVVVAGDLNAVAARIDHCEPDADFEKRSTVRWMQGLLSSPSPPASDSPPPAPPPPLLVDTFRLLHPTQAGAFTCWSTQTGARKTNYGTRIDYILATPGLSKQLRAASVRQEVEGSDHCPVVAVFRGVPEGAEQLDPSAPPPALAAAHLFRAKQSKLHAFLVQGRGSDHREGQQQQQQQQQQGPDPDVDGSGSSGGPSLPFSDAPSAPTSPTATSSARGGGGAAASAGAGGQEGKRTGRPQKQLRLDYFCVAKAVAVEDGRQQEGGGGGQQQVAVASTTTTIAVEQAKAVVVKSSGGGGGGGTSSSSSSSSKWKALFKPPPIPQCRHKEPAVERVVIKDGDNKGRRFFVCARPAGPPSHPLSRCDFFQWASEPKRFVGQPPPPAPAQKQQQGMPVKRKK